MTAPHPWYRSTQAQPLPGASVDHRGDFTPATPLERALGGPPIAVFTRLLVVSLVVGALLMWFDIRPFEIFDALRRLVDRLWYLGWDSVRTIVNYLAAGALIVVPCWLVLRLMNFRSR